MALIVENGTGLTNANAYVSVAYVDAYATAHNSATWTGNNVQKEAAIINATQYIDSKYKFNGSLLSLTQSLSFPRIDLYDGEGRLLTGVPKIIQDACCEFALVAHDKPLILSPETAAIKHERVKVGSIETETEYAVTGGLNTSYSICPIGDMMLQGLLNVVSNPNGGFVKFGKG